MVEPPHFSEKSRTYDPRPIVEFSEDELPQILKWPIDGKYKLVMEVEMRGIQEKDYGAYKGKKCATFKVLSVGEQSEQ